MVHVADERKWSVTGEEVHELGGEALREGRWDATVDSDAADVGDGEELPEEGVEPLIAEEERIASAQDHLLNLGVAPQVSECVVQFGPQSDGGSVGEEHLPETKPAIERAMKRGHQQRSVRIAMHKKGRGGVAMIPDGILLFTREGHQLASVGDGLEPDGTIWIVLVHEAEIVLADTELEAISDRTEPFGFSLRDHASFNEVPQFSGTAAQLILPASAHDPSDASR